MAAKKDILARILIVDDEPVIRRTLKDILDHEPYDVDTAEDGYMCLAMVKQKKYDVLFLDIKMPRLDGMEVLEQLRNLVPEVTVIMMSGHGSIDGAVDAVKKGAFDFIQKPLDLNRVLITIRNAIDRTSLIVENKKMIRKVGQIRSNPIIGESESIRYIKKQIETAAPEETARVMITGPNGTGKELVARSIHEKSPRSDGPFVEVNCAAIPSELIESILFGHIKGSFTGAYKDQVGKFEQAQGGTIFLDEIGDMSLDAQAKILRALQEKKLTRIGSDKDIAFDVRVIAATNKDLEWEIKRGCFREDLFHRLNTIEIKVPALNNRKDDIELLCIHFMKQICEESGRPEKRFAPDAVAALQNVDWTGNIRQLRNVVERLTIFCRDKNVITEEDILEHVGNKRNLVSDNPLHDIFDRFDNIEDMLRFMAGAYTNYKKG